MTENKILISTSNRLGVYDGNAIKKTEEFLRVLHNKGGPIKQINDTAKTVICLDLATTFLGLTIDKDTALKLTGVTKSVYRNNLHIIEKVLELDTPLSIAELCVQLDCTVIKELAEEIWLKYKNADNKIKDFSHPQYVAAAIYTACRITNLIREAQQHFMEYLNKSHNSASDSFYMAAYAEVQKQQFVQVSRLKSAQWKELLSEFENYVNVKNLQINKNKQEEDDFLAELSTEMEEMEGVQNCDNHDEEGKIEDYEVWKTRILKEAKKALGRND